MFAACEGRKLIAIGDIGFSGHAEEQGEGMKGRKLLAALRE
jgi:hypothetical protein